MGFFYGKKYNSGNGTFSLETGENFIEGTGHSLLTELFLYVAQNISANDWKMSWESNHRPSFLVYDNKQMPKNE